ncbi:hypothetical protein CLF_100199, partial [Clonorchis sinensis]
MVDTVIRQLDIASFRVVDCLIWNGNFFLRSCEGRFFDVIVRVNGPSSCEQCIEVFQKFIVVNGGHELSQPILDKLQSMICELSERKYNPSHNQKKFVTAGRELPEGKNVLTITDSTSLETEREDTVTDY